MPYKPYTVFVNGQEILPQRGFHSTEISPLVHLGFSVDDAVEMLEHRRNGNSRYVAIIAKSLTRGISRKETDEALELNRPAIQTYIDAREAGKSHMEALEEIRDLHVCIPSVTRQVGALNPVLGTGEVTHITSCVCGKDIWRNTIRKNWSGD